MSEHDGFAQEFYWRMREAITGRLSRDAKRIIEKKKKGGSRPFEKGRDPVSAGSTLDALIKDFKWAAELGEAELFNNWSAIVGEDTAAKAIPETLVEGVLTVRCSSTAWATQLNAVGQDLLNTIQKSAPGAGVASLAFIGPQAPSWKRGLRTIKNERGPRDTYG